MTKKLWYLLSYDIRHEKRLKKFHYRLSKHALALQKSVFLIEAGDEELQRIVQLVERYTHTAEDDVRLYPIAHPKAIWTAGQQANAFSYLAGPKPDAESFVSNVIRSIKPFWRKTDDIGSR